MNIETKTHLLNLPSGDKTSDCSDSSDCETVTNTDFLRETFGESTLECPIAVSFRGNPHNVSKHSWNGQPCTEKTVFQKDANNYISFATYTPDCNDKYRRKKTQFAALHAVMLDDVGTKVDIDRVTLAPSWVIETSQGNYQHGFMLDKPLRDLALATNVLDSIIAAELCDPGANGACTRMGRLPVGMNGKYDFVCRLVIWEPSRKYTVQQLVDGLQIELKEKPVKTRSPLIKTDDEDDVHQARDDQNPVLVALQAGDLYKTSLGGGIHDITCPWIHEHTDQSDTGTAYFEPSDTYPVGGFKCCHGHCADRHIGALLTFLDITKTAAKHLPTIRIMAGEISRIVDTLELEMSKTQRHYQRSGQIVTVGTCLQTASAVVTVLTVHNLMRTAATIAVWQRFNKRENNYVTCDPPEKYIRILHDSQDYPHLPLLNGIARQPYFRQDGVLSQGAGYDPTTGMFGTFNSQEFDIPAAPSKAQAFAALAIFTSLLDEFSFKTPADRAATLAAILTAVVRPSLNLAPMIHVNAPQPGSGKSYLCELITLFATPEKPSPSSFPADEEETKKMLLAELLKAPAVIEFDNMTTDLLPHKSLCTALTSERISGRILGQTKTVDISTNTLFLSSGNNVEPVRDMTRRTLVIGLDPKCENPITRQFKGNPVLKVKKERGVYVSAALTVVLAWITANKPITAVKPVNGYEQWGDYCRQPLLWLGMPDPAAGIFEAMAHDPDRAELGAFLEACEARYGSTIFSAKTIKSDHVLCGDLKEVVPGFVIAKDGQVDSKLLGFWLKRHLNRVVDGLRVVEDKTFKSHSKNYRIDVLDRNNRKNRNFSPTLANLADILTPTDEVSL